MPGDPDSTLYSFAMDNYILLCTNGKIMYRTDFENVSIAQHMVTLLKSWSYHTQMPIYLKVK